MTAAEPRRLTPTERLHEVTMAAMNRPRAESEQSCTITRNARGIVQFEITVRGPIAYEVSDQARGLFDELCDTYPYPLNGAAEGTGAPEGPAEPATHARSRGEA